MIRRKKVHSGIFTTERLEASESQADIAEATKTIIKNINLEAMIKGYEEQAKVILKSKKYPTSLDQLWPINDLPAQIADIKTMLHRFDIVREKVQENDAEWAAWNMGLAIHAAIRVQIRPIEPVIKKGVEFTDKRKKEFVSKIVNPMKMRKVFAEYLIVKYPRLNAAQLAAKILDESRAIKFKHDNVEYIVYRMRRKGRDSKLNLYIRFKSEIGKFDYSMDTFINSIQEQKNLR